MKIREVTLHMSEENANIMYRQECLVFDYVGNDIACSVLLTLSTLPFSDTTNFPYEVGLQATTVPDFVHPKLYNALRPSHSHNNSFFYYLKSSTSSMGP